MMTTVPTRVPMVRYALIISAVSVVLLWIWPGLWSNLMSERGYMPHGHCYLWQPNLVWLHVSADALIATAYITIPVTLAVLVHRVRHDIPFNWMVVAFGIFIISCGATHLMSIWTLWNPTYWLSGYVKLITALASVTTAVLLPPLVPKVAALVASAKQAERHRLELEATNIRLADELAQRQKAEAANERLVALDALKSTFITNVSHEIRTPLTSIKSFARILENDLEQQRLTAEKRIQFLGIINEESDRLTRLINDVLDLAKMEAGKTTWHDQPTDLTATIGQSREVIAPLAEQAEVTLTVDLPDALPTISLDPDKWQQVLTNLLSNAVKFTPAGGSVTLTARPVGAGDDAALRIEVADTGVGIEPAELEAIFEQFHQVTQGDAMAKPTGSGLGLPITRHIVDHYGGRIWATSTPGQGSTFHIHLPLVPTAVTVS